VTTLVHPVWWLAPKPAPLSPWKCSQNKVQSFGGDRYGSSPMSYTNRRPDVSHAKKPGKTIANFLSYREQIHPFA
jgi:hypothetical protein